MTKWQLSQSGKVTSVCTEDVDCTVNAKLIFWQENEEYLLFTMGWRGRLLFFLHTPHRRCCLCNDVTPTEKNFPSCPHFYSLQLQYIHSVFDIEACHEEVDVI